MVGGILLAVAVLLACGAAVLYAFRSRGPYSGESRGEQRLQEPSQRYYERADRPAGPDAEPMDPGELGGDQRTPE